MCSDFNVSFYSSDHTIEAYDILVALLESELGQLLANLRATGIGAGSSPHENIKALSSLPCPTPPSSTSNNISTCNNNALQKVQPSSISSGGSGGGSSGNNNNSNDSSPTGEHFKSTIQDSASSHLNLSTSTTTTTTSATMIVATSTTTTMSTCSVSPVTAFTTQEEMDIRVLIERANENRLTAENAARVLLSRFMMDSPASENNNSMIILPLGSVGDQHNQQGYHLSHNHNHTSHVQLRPWEEASSGSQTLRFVLVQ